MSNGQVPAPVLVLPTPEPAPTPAPEPEPLPVASGKPESALNAVRQATPPGRPGFGLPGKSPVFTDRLVVKPVRNGAGEIVAYEVSEAAAR